MDVEAYQLVVALLGQVHDFGESISDKMELWISISSGLIVMAYFAPDRLKPGIATYVVALYIAFSVFIFSNIAADASLSRAAIADASRIASELQIQSSELKYRLDEGGSGSSLAALMFMAGLFFGTIWYVSYTAYRTYKDTADGT